MTGCCAKYDIEKCCAICDEHETCNKKCTLTKYCKAQARVAIIKMQENVGPLSTMLGIRLEELQRGEAGSVDELAQIKELKTVVEWLKNYDEGTVYGRVGVMTNDWKSRSDD